MAAYQAAAGELAGEDIAVVAASTDDLERAAGTVAELGLSFPVGHGLPLVETAKRLGAFYEERRRILHATGFVLRPGGEIAVGCYSSGPIGRLVPEDVLRVVRFWKSRG